MLSCAGRYRRKMTDPSLDRRERGAWRLYLKETKPLRGRSYEEVEPWAWAALVGRLAKIERERKMVAA